MALKHPDTAAVTAAIVLATVVPVWSAMASPRTEPVRRPAPPLTYDGFIPQPRGVHDHPRHTGCPQSSASEGNAEQQNFPVKQYGQTSGGYRC